MKKIRGWGCERGGGGAVSMVRGVVGGRVAMVCVCVCVSEGGRIFMFWAEGREVMK